jgi:hypothetical protein
MTNNCGNGFRGQFASIPGVAVWAVLPGALATLAGEVGTDLGRQVLREDICGLGIMFGEKKHAHVRDMALLGWVGSTIAAGILLALDGSHFCTLVWGGRMWVLSGRTEAEMGAGARVPIFELVLPGGEFGYSGSKDGDGAVRGLRKG